MFKRICGALLTTTMALAYHAAVALDDKNGDSTCNLDLYKIPGAYLGNISNADIFNSQGQVVGKSFLGRMLMLFPASGSSKGGMALTSAIEWDVAGANTFPDPSSTAKGPLAGLIQDNQQQPNFGSWLCVGDKIRVMSFEYYFEAKNALFDGMRFKGTNRNTKLLEPSTPTAAGFTTLTTTAGSLEEIDPNPNCGNLSGAAQQTCLDNPQYDPANPNAIINSGFAATSLPVYTRMPNFGNDLLLP